MRVYLCVNRVIGLGLLKSSPKIEQSHRVYTQKQTAIKEFQNYYKIFKKINTSNY